MHGSNGIIPKNHTPEGTASDKTPRQTFLEGKYLADEKELDRLNLKPSWLSGNSPLSDEVQSIKQYLASDQLSA